MQIGKDKVKLQKSWLYFFRETIAHHQETVSIGTERQTVITAVGKDGGKRRGMVS